MPKATRAKKAGKPAQTKKARGKATKAEPEAEPEAELETEPEFEFEPEPMTGEEVDRARREWKPLDETMNTFSSYEIHRFRDAASANAAADGMGVAKKASWLGSVYRINNLDKLTDHEGIYSESSRGYIQWNEDIDTVKLGEWLANYTTGDVLTPLRAFLEHMNATFIRDGTGYVGYEMRLFTDKWEADGYPLCWHVDECHVVNHFGMEWESLPLNVTTALKGPGTLFLRDQQQAWKNRGDIVYEVGAEKEQVQAGELAIYRTTPNCLAPLRHMTAAVHARPDDEDGERVVVQLMLCTKRQMKGVRVLMDDALAMARNPNMIWDFYGGTSPAPDE